MIDISLDILNPAITSLFAWQLIFIVKAMFPMFCACANMVVLSYVDNNFTKLTCMYKFVAFVRII